MIISAYLGTAGLLDVGYQFRNADESANGARVTAGIVDAADGWYSTVTTIPGGAASVRWNSAGTAAAKAREYFSVASATVDVLAIADAVLMRDWTTLTGEPAYCLFNAARMLRNVWNTNGGTLTVKKENGTADAWARTLSVDPAAQPITGAT
jgi:hypothetical protein